MESAGGFQEWEERTQICRKERWMERLDLLCREERWYARLDLLGMLWRWLFLLKEWFEEEEAWARRSGRESLVLLSLVCSATK